MTLGGSPTDLTTAVDNALLLLCGQGRLEKPAVHEKLVVLHPFSGSGICKQAFLDAGYTHVLENDLVTARNMGPCIDDVQLLEHYDASTVCPNGLRLREREGVFPSKWGSFFKSKSGNHRKN